MTAVREPQCSSLVKDASRLEDDLGGMSPNDSNRNCGKEEN